MSKSELGPELLQDQLTAVDDKILTQRSSEVLSKTNRDRDAVTPFAEDIIDNVVTGALSILDISRKEGKPWKEVVSANKSPSENFSGQNIRSLDEDGADSLFTETETSNSSPSADAQRPVVQVMHLRVRDDVIRDSVHAEQVAKIVKGLQDIQIGDSAYVLPADGSNIEKQVKEAVRNINSLEFGDMETVQLIICDGQGDVDATILEAEVGPPSNANYKPQHDASKISTCFLHKMIEELEDNDSTDDNLPKHGNKEGIASWEESEEKFIRTIEGPGDERGPLAEYQEHSNPVIFDRESVALAAENGAENRNLVDSSGQSQQGFSKGEEIHDRKDGKRPRDRLDNYTDEEPYWCTAGLITRVVTPQHGEVSVSKIVMTEKESGTSGLEANLPTRRTVTSLSVSEHIEPKLEAKVKASKLKDKKKPSFGRRLRTFFSRFKRSRDC